MTTAPCPMSRLVLAHFAGEISVRGERTLREHLPRCASCRRYYDQQLLLSELDPQAWTAEERLAHGLGLSARPLSAKRFELGLVFSAVALAAAVLILPRFALRHGASPAAPAVEEFTPRGSALVAKPSLSVYRLRAGEPSSLVQDRVAATDELAFAYVNPQGFEHLLVFGVDEHGHVYWYHPAWTNAAEDPVAIAIQSGPELQELPEAVRQELDGSSLRIVALFTHARLSVHEVEREIDRRAARGAPLTALVPGAFQTELELRVEAR